jgi:hypothetical protein
MALATPFLYKLSYFWKFFSKSAAARFYNISNDVLGTRPLLGGLPAPTKAPPLAEPIILFPTKDVGWGRIDL